VTRRRLRFIAIQAIVVCVLGAVVVLTLLRPESNMSLSGVNGPGGTTSIADGGGDQHPGGQHSGGGSAGGGANTGGGNGGRGSGPASAAQGAVSPGTAATVPAPTPGTTPGTGGSDGGSPTDDQYADTLTRLSAELN
jgi:hypothetical protein